MADILNLRRARKAKAKSEQDALAAANRATHGQSGAEKRTRAAEKQMAERRLDNHKRDRQTES